MARGPSLPEHEELIALWLQPLDTYERHRAMRVCKAWQSAARLPALNSVISLPPERAWMSTRQRASFNDAALDRLVDLADGGLTHLRLYAMNALSFHNDLSVGALATQTHLHTVSLCACRGVHYTLLTLLPQSVRVLEIAGCERIRPLHLENLRIDRPQMCVDVFTCDECEMTTAPDERAVCDFCEQFGEAESRRWNVCKDCKPLISCRICKKQWCKDSLECSGWGRLDRRTKYCNLCAICNEATSTCLSLSG